MCHTFFQEGDIPRQRATGAAKPYTYWHSTRSKAGTAIPPTNGPNGGWSKWIQAPMRTGKRMRKTLTGKTSNQIKNKVKADREELRDTGTLSDRDRQRVDPRSTARACATKCCKNWMGVRMTDFVPPPSNTSFTIPGRTAGLSAAGTGCGDLPGPDLRHGHGGQGHPDQSR